MKNDKHNTNKLRRTIFIFLSIIISIIILALVLNYFKIISLQDILYNFSPSNHSGTINRSYKKSGQIIAKTGTENIYQSDLDEELSYYPFKIDEANRKLLLNKIIKDSIILQSAQSAGWIKLDNSVFNNPQKNYFKRQNLVNDIRLIYENRQNITAGNVISIWFHNMVPAEIGYEKGKEIALQKITNLHNNVKTKRTSIFIAIQAILDDESLIRVDKAYKSNAVLSFRAKDNENITFDPEFDAIIKNLNEGEVSDIYLAKDKDISGKMIDAVYMFAQVDYKSRGGKQLDFDKWYEQREKVYEVIYY